ncbi:MAG: hypothetical protein KC451_01875 [Amylibacter sp.]|jgi:YHS domain-containing protein|nr:hypothetical protein [Amylibacter sp.]
MSKSKTFTPTRRAVLVASVFVGGVSLALPVFATGRIAKDGATGAAIRGYDTTAYFVKNAATRGSEVFAVNWRGATWRFASQEDADLFSANPEGYAPQFGGYCTRAASFKKLVPADPEVWRIYDHKLYMFAQPVGGKKFEQGQDAMIKKAKAFWATLD